MTGHRTARPGIRTLALAASLLAAAPAFALQAPADDAAAITADFEKGLKALETTRIERLDQLAQTQLTDQATATYESLFRFALDTQLFAAAEPAAERVIQAGTFAPSVSYLAHIVNVMAEADRGDFEQSVQSIVSAVDRGQQRGADGQAAQRAALPAAAKLSVLEAYYQRLAHAHRLDLAAKAFTLIQKSSLDTGETAVSEYAAARLAQIGLVGQTAPPFQGKDQDGKPVSLAAFQGKAVLLVFWATWCVPSGTQADWLLHLQDQYAEKGLQIVSVNLDTHQEDGLSEASVAPNVHRFLIDHNVTWPDLIDRPGDHSIATAYRINDIPASILIGPDGKVVDLDLSRTSAEPTIRKTLGLPAAE